MRQVNGLPLWMKQNPFGTSQGAVGGSHLAYLTLVQCFESKTAHLACANDKHACLAKIWEMTCGHAQSNRAHAHSASADLCLGTCAFANTDGCAEKGGKHRPNCACLQTTIMRSDHLPLNL